MLENDLTNIEMLMMKCIWDSEEELSLSPLVEMVNKRYHKDWRPQTISTYLAHLVKKDYLTMRRFGKVFLYQPKVSQQDYQMSQIKAVVDYWSEPVSPIEFMTNLYIAEKRLKEMEKPKSRKDSLKEMIDDLDK